MGASGWNFVADYEKDVELALLKARQQAFESKMYWCPTDRLRKAVSTYRSGRIEVPEKIVAEAEARLKEWEAQEPRNIQELLDRCDPSGHWGAGNSHSIIDIIGVSKLAKDDHVSPVSKKDLKDAFGTEKPSMADIERAFEENHGSSGIEFERQQAVYYLVYEDGKPTQIVFEGMTGD